MIISTTDSVPGFVVHTVVGDGMLCASDTELSEDAAHDNARRALVDKAEKAGADALVGYRVAMVERSVSVSVTVMATPVTTAPAYVSRPGYEPA